MARFHGKVGFLIVTDNQDTGIVQEEVVEKTFYGRVIEHSRRWQSSDMLNDDLQLGNQISITAKDYAFKHASCIKYCEFMGGLWSVTSIRIKYPEIILTLGGVYHGPKPSAVADTTEDNSSESVVQETT